MSFSTDCCTNPIIQGKKDYQPKGVFESVSEVSVYVVGEDFSQTLVCIYDIFGFHSNTFQFLDKLSKEGKIRIIVPDFFKGKPWDSEQIPMNLEKLMKWIQTFNFDTYVQPIINSVYERYSLNQVDKVGLIGFCWGGYIIKQTFQSDQSKFDFGVMVHPSMVSLDDLEKFNKPVGILATKGELQLLNGFTSLSSEVAKHSQVYDFTDQEHGFAAGRANFDDLAGVQRIEDAIETILEYLTKRL